MPSKIHRERTIHQPSPLMKALKPVEWIVMRDRQISVCSVAYQLPILTTTIHEIMSNHMGMTKVSIRWVSILLTLIQRSKIVVKSFCKRAK